MTETMAKRQKVVGSVMTRRLEKFNLEKHGTGGPRKRDARRSEPFVDPMMVSRVRPCSPFNEESAIFSAYVRCFPNRYTVLSHG